MPDGELHPAVAATGEERARRIRAMFAGIAPRYELVNRVTSVGLDRSWRRAVAGTLQLREGDWCLDLCCGTGDLARAVASASGAQVIAADFCRPMLAHGRGTGRGGRAGEPATWLEADARQLPVRSASMDAACVAFGIRNVVPPAEGLREMVRVVRPGGRVAVLEFGEPRVPGLRGLYHLYSRHVLPVVGDMLSGRRGTYRYLPQTIGAWLSPDALAREMEAAGLHDVGWRSLTFGIVVLHWGTVPHSRA